MNIPPSLLFDLQNGREHLNRVLGEGWQSAENIMKAMRSAYSEAKKLDDTMWLDMAFVEESYEELMEKKLKQNLMDVLPEGREVWQRLWSRPS